MTGVGSGRPGTVNWANAKLMRLEADGHGDDDIYIHDVSPHPLETVEWDQIDDGRDPGRVMLG